MKKGVIWFSLTCMIMITLVLSSCNKTTTATSTSTSTTTSTATATKTTTNTTTTSTTSTTSTTTTTTGNWWDKYGIPQYGGEFSLSTYTDKVNFDPYVGPQLNLSQGWAETLFGDDWTLNPSVFGYTTGFRPIDYVVGMLAKSWEFSDPSTLVVHLRQGINWQNLPPVNGRGFVAADVEYSYDRLFGLGDGFTKPAPYWGAVAAWKNLISVTATDNYTVAFKWKITSPASILGTMTAPGAQNNIMPREAVQQWGDLNDWHHVVGTGPFFLTDAVAGSSVTLKKNPNYWGYDERYPQNKLPYVDKITILIIPDSNTVLAGVRTGKIDMIGGLTYDQVQSAQKTNPQILTTSVPFRQPWTIDPRNDIAPFSDIKVRQAMQMAIDLPTIAKTYYNGTAPGYPVSLTNARLGSWSWPYAQWPQTLQDEYAYNPTKAKQLLADAGYPNGFHTTIDVINTNDLGLLQIAQSEFAAVGIIMDIHPMDTGSFTAETNNHKQTQMVQGNPSLGSSADPMSSFNNFLTGAPYNNAMVSDPVFDGFYNQTLKAASMDDLKQIIINTNKYVAAQHYVVCLTAGDIMYLYQPWVKGGFWGQNQSLCSNEFLLLSEYGARFWVDENLKKSLGH